VNLCSLRLAHTTIISSSSFSSSSSSSRPSASLCRISEQTRQCPSLYTHFDILAITHQVAAFLPPLPPSPPRSPLHHLLYFFLYDLPVLRRWLHERFDGYFSKLVDPLCSSEGGVSIESIGLIRNYRQSYPVVTWYASSFVGVLVSKFTFWDNFLIRSFRVATDLENRENREKSEKLKLENWEKSGKI